MSNSRIIKKIKSRPRDPKCRCCIAKELRDERKAVRLAKETERHIL